MGDLTAQNTQLPDHIRAAFGQTTGNSDLTTGVSMGYPIVSYKGKNWHVVENNERHLITADNGEDPAQSIRVVIIKANPNLNKVYYPDGYEEGTTERPLCHSNDAIAPAADAQQPQSPKCATCKFNQFGSKITDNGARGKACQDSRRLAIAPEADLERAMLLRVPPASLRNLLAYAQGLEKRGVPYQALVTKIGFDHTVAYPQLTFKAESWLDAEQVATVKKMMGDDLVENICALNMTGHAEPEAAAAPADDFLPPGGPAETPKQTKTTKAKATDAEVEAATKSKGATGFGTRKVVETETPAVSEAAEAPAADKVDVLTEGAMAELDAALADFDD